MKKHCLRDNSAVFQIRKKKRLKKKPMQELNKINRVELAGEKKLSDKKKRFHNFLFFLVGKKENNVRGGLQVR